MLRFFEYVDRCSMIIDAPIGKDDILNMQSLFDRYGNVLWSLEFGRIYSLQREITLMLYREIFIKKKIIYITTHKNKLSRYFHRLGFKATFISLIKDEIVSSSAIEIVLIGGSADSSQKIMNIVKCCSFENLTLVVVQHVEAHKDGIFDEILQPYSSNRVSYAKDGETPRRGRIYIAPRDKHLRVVDGIFFLTNERKHNYSRPSISVSYESFSNYYRDSLLIIQECGYLNDGVDRLSLARQNGSKIVIQDAKECEAKSMVSDAIAIENRDYIFNEKSIIDYIDFLENKFTTDEWITYLLEMIYLRYSYDFRLYQRDMVARRLEVFMLKHEIKSDKEAVGAILFNRSIFKSFFLELSINVTEFFRNPDSFKDIVKFIKRVHKKSRNIKIWSAGSSSGKEAYSLAIILSHLGILDRSLIYATDFNSVIIQEAKSAIYSNTSYEVALKNFELIGLNDSLQNYIIKNDNFMMIDKKIMRRVLFLEHNLTTDASFNEFDIIICKNVIIYFNSDLQRRVFKLIYDSLKFGGHLILGESEGVEMSFVDRFELVSDDKSKIYRKVA